jgi:exodeoxyribonuclease VII small subunit
MAAKKKDSLKYGEAREKLEQILKEIEGNDVDVDDLTDRVKEAAMLIQVCRKKLSKTRVEVEKVVAEMDLEEEEKQAPPGTDEAPF